jgi:hypothetical protein
MPDGVSAAGFRAERQRLLGPRRVDIALVHQEFGQVEHRSDRDGADTMLLSELITGARTQMG